MMEELISIASIAPVILSIIALITTSISFVKRAKAEAEFVLELSKKLKENVERHKAMLEGMDKGPIQLKVNANSVDLKDSSDAVGVVSDATAKFSISSNHLDELSAEIYHIYFSSVKGLGENKELPEYVKGALHGLTRSDKKHIVKALSQPSARGRMRYFDKVFKMASKAVASG